MLPIKKLKLLKDYNFLFKPTTIANFIIYIYLVDYNIKGILIKNDTNHLIQITKKLKLSNVTEIDFENCF